MSNRLYVIAGEMSGDIHGAELLRSLRDMMPSLNVRGAGGSRMADVAGEGIRDWVEDAAVMGVWEVLKRYAWFKKQFQQMLGELKQFQPAVLLLIDYPGFNLRFASAVRQAFPKIRIVYYISPQVWAWHRGRVPKMVALLDEMLCLFPFEKPIFDQAGLKTTFVGHPLLDELAELRSDPVARDASLVGFFPGSREREVARLFPVMIESAKRLRAWRSDLVFEVPAASPKLAMQIRALLAATGASDLVRVSTGTSHDLMQRACCGVIASGTATLEAAILGLPYCLVYRVAPLTYALGRLLVKIKHIGLVNILAGTEVVRELIQAEANAHAVSQELRALLGSPEARETLSSRLADTAKMLGEPGTHQRAAAAVSCWFDAPDRN
ncbi:MAG: lipid-A-disaccharide synthase [Luteolibacter sp.]